MTKRNEVYSKKFIDSTYLDTGSDEDSDSEQPVDDFKNLIPKVIFK